MIRRTFKVIGTSVIFISIPYLVGHFILAKILHEKPYSVWMDWLGGSCLIGILALAVLGTLGIVLSIIDYIKYGNNKPCGHQ